MDQRAKCPGPHKGPGADRADRESIRYVFGNPASGCANDQRREYVPYVIGSTRHPVMPYGCCLIRAEYVGGCCPGKCGIPYLCQRSGSLPIVPTQAPDEVATARHAASANASLEPDGRAAYFFLR